MLEDSPVFREHSLGGWKVVQVATHRKKANQESVHLTRARCDTTKQCAACKHLKRRLPFFILSSPLTPSYSSTTPSKGRRAIGGGLIMAEKEESRMVEFSALPDYMRDNEYILRHYRAECPLKHTLLSIFSIHNETLNVWTHLVGFILFLCLTIYTATKLPNVADLPVPNKANLHRLQNEIRTWPMYLPNMAELQAELRTSLPNWVGNCIPGNFSQSNQTEHCILQTIKDDVTNMVFPHSQGPITRWPFLVFLGAATYCLFASATFHLLSCHSKRLYYIMLRLDYSGIVALIAASFYPPVYYSFMCTPFFRKLYLTAITLLGIATVLVSLLPAFQNPEFRTLRAALFSGMAVWGVAPVVHKMILHKGEPEAFQTAAYEIGMGCCYVLGVLVYATRIPERWKPGKFDIAGHSHQLFHILVIAGAYTHYQAGLLYLKWRDLKGC